MNAFINMQLLSIETFCLSLVIGDALSQT